MITLHTNRGDIKIELFADKAPITCANFEQYCRDGHYDGTLFHRVINDFMIQGGGYDKAFVEKDTRAPIRNEAKNGLSNKIGTLAMARTSDPHSASAQFFINVADNTYLDFSSETTQGWGYCVFGQVTAGMDVVNKIKAMKTGSVRVEHLGGMMRDVPKEQIVIERVTVA